MNILFVLFAWLGVPVHCIHSVFSPLALRRCWFQVSWIRKRDLHILTVGILTYTNDQRFQALHQEGSDEWTLKISSPQPRDSGTYECQVSMEPKISQAFRLSVIGKWLLCIYFFRRHTSVAVVFMCVRRQPDRSVASPKRISKKFEIHWRVEGGRCGTEPREIRLHNGSLFEWKNPLNFAIEKRLIIQRLCKP